MTEKEKQILYKLVCNDINCGTFILLPQYVDELITKYLKAYSVKENADSKSKADLSIDCEKAQINGELCLGYGGDEDEPCERCKNCIKCECGYYQLGETEKDEQLTKAKEIIKDLLSCLYSVEYDRLSDLEKAEQFLKGE